MNLSTKYPAQLRLANEDRKHCAQNLRYSPALKSSGRRKIKGSWETKGSAAGWTRLKAYLLGYARQLKGRKGSFTVGTLPTQEWIASRLGLSREWVNQCAMMLRNERGAFSMAAEGILLIAGRNERGHQRVFILDATHTARTKGRYVYITTCRPSDPKYNKAKHRFKLSHSKKRLNRIIDKEFLQWLVRPALDLIDIPCEVISPTDISLRDYISMIRPQERPDSALAPPEAHQEPLDFITDPRIKACQRTAMRIRNNGNQNLLFKAEGFGTDFINVGTDNRNIALSPEDSGQKPLVDLDFSGFAKLRKKLQNQS